MRWSMLAAASLAVASASAAAVPAEQAMLSDPVTLGWMQGSPPPPERQIRFDDGSMWRFPQIRWSFSNIQALLPSAVVARAPGPASPLPRALRDDLDSVTFTTADGRRMRWGEAFDALHTDGILVLHRGRIVYERHAGALRPDGRHIAFSVTKSFVGTLAELLIHEGRLDPSRPVAAYVPELAASGYATATIRDLMDMRVAVDFDETYSGEAGELSDVVRMAIAAGSAPRPAGHAGPIGNFAFAASLKATGAHGGDFVYRTPNTSVLQWVVERVGGAPLAAQLSERIWKPMGMAQEATLHVDPLGTAFGGGGLSANLSDMARFGEMIRLGGRWNGRQILPPEVVRAIRTPGDTEAFRPARYPGMAGGSYRSQWWHRAEGQLLAVGVHGQGIWIDPAAELVIARFASHPVASNRAINPVSVPAYEALTAHLQARRR